MGNDLFSCAHWMQWGELLTVAHKSPFIPVYWRNTPQNKNLALSQHIIGCSIKIIHVISQRIFYSFSSRIKFTHNPPSINYHKYENELFLTSSFCKSTKYQGQRERKKIKKVADWLIYHVHSDNCFSFSLLTSSWPWSTTDTWKTHWLMDSVKRILLKMCINITSACNYEEKPMQEERIYYVLL